MSLLVAIKGERHGDGTCVGEGQDISLCLVPRPIRQKRGFLSQSWTVLRYSFLRYTYMVNMRLASATGGRSTKRLEL